uniref:1-acylglycerol-3-phosphate O-acyltransferase n=1 Tax=Schistocephalus solidus TaxID=70667 RepID=A0A0V0J6S9_SCHSO
MFTTIIWYLSLVAVTLVLVIPKYRSKLRYFLSFILYGIVMVVGSAIYLVRFMFKGPSYSNSCDFTTVFRCCRWCMGLQPRIYGLDTYDDKQQYIFVINHQSFIDVLSLCDLWREPSSVIAKEVLRYFGPVGLIMHYCKMIFIRRSNHEKALEVMREAAELVKRDKINLFMFPEGTRCNTGRLMPFKKGAFHLAIQTQIPIQPIVISCYNKFLNHSERLYSPVPYGVYLLPPIQTKGLKEDQANSLMERTYAAMKPIFDLTAAASPEELGSDLRKKL